MGEFIVGFVVSGYQANILLGNWGNLSADMPRVFSVMELCYEDVFK